jgi:MFS family permease
LITRALRGFADGIVSVALASYLSGLGYSPGQIGAIVTSTLLGSAVLSLFVGFVGQRFDQRQVLLAASLLMAATGLGFAGVTAFWALLLVAFVGTLNPSAGDVSVFLPTEQALLAGFANARDRTHLFALYNLAGAFAGALGALATGVPVWIARHAGVAPELAGRATFTTYTAVAVLVAVLYFGMPAVTRSALPAPSTRPLAKSRATVLRLAVLFSLDSFGGGFVVQSLLALWLFRRFGLSVEATGTVFFVAGLLAAGSQLASSRLAARIGHVRTMVFTHLPANVFLILAAFMPTAELAIGFLLLRMALAQMDVPARQAYVMAVVPAEERAAAASVTNLPRSLAAALTPLLAGVLLQYSDTGWPLVFGGGIKVLYDLLLLAQFHSVRPLDET